MDYIYESIIESSLSDGEIILRGATDKELTILGRTKKARVRKKYTDRIIRRAALVI